MTKDSPLKQSILTLRLISPLNLAARLPMDKSRCARPRRGEGGVSAGPQQGWVSMECISCAVSGLASRNSMRQCHSRGHMSHGEVLLQKDRLPPPRGLASRVCTYLLHTCLLLPSVGKNILTPGSGSCERRARGLTPSSRRTDHVCICLLADARKGFHWSGSPSHPGSFRCLSLRPGGDEL